MQTIRLDNEAIKKINGILYKYIWNRRYSAPKAPERIKRELVNCDIKRGGLGMLDISELDASIKLKALGRLLDTAHPFLSMIKSQLIMESFLNPRIKVSIESVSTAGILLLRKDREALLDIKELDVNVPLLKALKKEKIKDVLTAQGRGSLSFFAIHRRGKRFLGDLDYNELRDLERFLPGTSLVKFTNAIRLNVQGLGETDLTKSYWGRHHFKSLNDFTSKEIRMSRHSGKVVQEWKVGLNVLVRDSLAYSCRISKLTSVKLKSVLLRILHGDIYTKDRLHRFGLSDNNTCPRCDEVETIQHKFFNCDYVKRIWNKVGEKLGFDSSDDILEKALGFHPDCDPDKLVIHCEILKRILYLKEDNNYLVRPKIFVDHSLKSLLTMERNAKTKRMLKALLDND